MTFGFSEFKLTRLAGRLAQPNSKIENPEKDLGLARRVTLSESYKWTQPEPMGSKIYPEVHENPRAFFNSSSPILLEPLAHGSGNWSLPREDCIIPSPLKRI
ncbi:hypothetical protein HKD37_03G006706 [Glycine soja]